MRMAFCISNDLSFTLERQAFKLPARFHKINFNSIIKDFKNNVILYQNAINISVLIK